MTVLAIQDLNVTFATEGGGSVAGEAPHGRLVGVGEMLRSGIPSSSRQIASSVLKRIPLTLPFLSRDRLGSEMPMRSESSSNDSTS